MNIAIIGAGFTGLSAAYQLTKKGHTVTVFEKDPHPGGLAIGYQEKNWGWTLEKHYHHWFTNDDSILGLAKEIGHKVIIKRPKTCVYVDGKIYQFDSPKEVLLFPKLSPLERFRMAAIVGLIRYNPFWKPLEKINASTFLPRAMGEKSYQMIWEPQFTNKFGKFATDVSLAWFWARITKRTPSLAYPEGGFLVFANHLVDVIKQQGGKILFNTEVAEITKETVKWGAGRNPSPPASEARQGRATENKSWKTEQFDKIIVTLPTSFFIRLTPELPQSYATNHARLKGLGATNLVLRLKKPFLPNDTYWLSVCDPKAPIMAIVEHTNYMDKKHYDNEHLVYLGNYLAPDDPKFLMDKEEKLKLFDPFLKKISPDYKNNLIGYELFKAPFAQPIIPTNYSRMIPSMTTPLPNVYLANIEQVYPWDRGTNYAVALGEKVAELID